MIKLGCKLRFAPFIFIIKPFLLVWNHVKFRNNEFSPRPEYWPYFLSHVFGGKTIIRLLNVMLSQIRYVSNHFLDRKIKKRMKYRKEPGDYRTTGFNRINSNAEDFRRWGKFRDSRRKVTQKKRPSLPRQNVWTIQMNRNRRMHIAERSMIFRFYTILFVEYRSTLDKSKDVYLKFRFGT